MVKRTITITTILLILSIAISLIIVLNKSSFAADGDIASGTSGTCSWVIDVDGVLTIEPTSDTTGTLASYISGDASWYNYRELIRKVIVKPGVKARGCHHLFYRLINCTEMDLSGLDTSATTSMHEMFRDCSKLESLDLSGFNTSNVSGGTQSSNGMGFMFYGCSSLKSLDVSSFDTSKLTYMRCMFTDCSSLETLDLSNFNTANVTDMQFMFKGCSKLESINVSSFNTSRVTGLYEMFQNCSSLKTLDLSSFSTPKANDIGYMFEGCTSLRSIKFSSGFNPIARTYVGMFQNCSSLTELDLSSFTNTNIPNGYAGYMFYGCSSLKSLDLSNFSTINVYGMGNMFTGCSSLDSIKLGENFRFKGSGITSEEEMATLPAPPSGRWVREDEAYGPYTPVELRNNYTSEMAGRWILRIVEQDYYVTYSYIDNIPLSASELPAQEKHKQGDEVTVAQDATAHGYNFSGWSTTGTFIMPEEDVNITGSFTARSDTQYKVEHYLEDETSGTYNLKETEALTGTTDTTKRATPKTYAGYTFDSAIDGTIREGTIKGDGSLVLKLYYRRNEVPVENGHRYKVQYFFDGVIDDSLEEIINAEVDSEVNITPTTPIKHGDKNYTLVSNNHKITISVNDDDNVIRVYYETDVLDYAIDNFEDTTEGDGIPDKYQISITYKVENGNWNDGTKGTKTDIITLKDKDGNLSEEGTGTTTIPEVGNKPNNGYTKGYWNKVIPNKVSNKDDGKEFVYSYESIDKVKSDISGGKGKSSNPKTDDIVNKYLLVGIGGVLVLALVSKIRRKYSRKAKKIQF